MYSPKMRRFLPSALPWNRETFLGVVALTQSRNTHTCTALAIHVEEKWCLAQLSIVTGPMLESMHNY